MKKINFLIIALFLLFTISCGKKSENVESKKESSKEEVKKEEGKSPGESKDESKLNINDLGISEGMPSDFPSDIPKPNNSKVLGYLSSSDGTVVTFESTDKVKDIMDFYKNEMKKNGFSTSEGGELLMSDEGGLMGWKKDNREVGLMLGLDKDKNVTSLVITYK